MVDKVLPVDFQISANFLNQLLNHVRSNQSLKWRQLYEGLEAPWRRRRSLTNG
jgi:hypothetical protein